MDVNFRQIVFVVKEQLHPKLSQAAFSSINREKLTVVAN
jgi:hypothetical protein